MSVMLVKDIHATRLKLKSFATCDVNDLAFASEAIISLHMVPILQFHLGALFDGGIVEGETNAVCCNDQSLTIPSFTANVSQCSNGRIDVSH
ncbi:hypothetical protein AWB81_06533 [Caballeronia arationis]|nr:hypothetical protein AWB81_06533 [Caballeronia arationis]